MIWHFKRITVESFQSVKSVFILYIKTIAFSIQCVYFVTTSSSTGVKDLKYTFASNISGQTALIGWECSCVT